MNEEQNDSRWFQTECDCGEIVLIDSEEFPDFFESGDAGFKDEDDYIWVMSRTDDIINVAGHRLSTGEMEEVLANHPDVAECAVISVSDELKGEVPLGVVVLNAGVNKPHKEIIDQGF